VTPPPVSGVRACISLPRICFSHSIFDIAGALFPLGIPVAHKCGIGWGQSMTDLIERVIEDPACRYVLTVDYDSRFVIGDVLELYRLMETHAEADAIAPVQVRRGTTDPLFTVRDPFTGKNKTSIAVNTNSELLRVHTGHFGLSMFRAGPLRCLPKPWFMSLPDVEGGWKVEKGALLEDMFFWRRWEDAGQSLYVTQNVRIGHGAEVVLVADDNLKGHMVELSQYERARDTN
jgi:hypothetical protein